MYGIREKYQYIIVRNTQKIFQLIYDIEICIFIVLVF